MSTQSHTQKPNDMSDTSKSMKSPNHATNPLNPLSLLPLSISPFGDKAPKRKARATNPGAKKAESEESCSEQ